MKALLAVLTLTAICSCGPAAERADQATQNELKEIASRIVEQMATGDFESIPAVFDSTMRNMLSPEKLAEGWHKKSEQYGKYLGHDEPTYTVFQGHDLAEVVCKFEKGNVPLHAFFNLEKKVSGLWLRPARK